MANSKPVPLDQPTRRTIEALFRELLLNYHRAEEDGPLGTRYRELDREHDALEERLLDNPRLKKLKLRRDVAYRTYDKKRREKKEKVVALRNLYLAKGITKKLLQGLDKLLANA